MIQMMRVAIEWPGHSYTKIEKTPDKTPAKRSDNRYLPSKGGCDSEHRLHLAVCKALWANCKSAVADIAGDSGPFNILEHHFYFAARGYCSYHGNDPFVTLGITDNRIYSLPGFPLVFAEKYVCFLHRVHSFIRLPSDDEGTI